MKRFIVTTLSAAVVLWFAVYLTPAYAHDYQYKQLLRGHNDQHEDLSRLFDMHNRQDKKFVKAVNDNRAYIRKSDKYWAEQMRRMENRLRSANLYIFTLRSKISDLEKRLEKLEKNEEKSLTPVE